MELPKQHYIYCSGLWLSASRHHHCGIFSGHAEQVQNQSASAMAAIQLGTQNRKMDELWADGGVRCPQQWAGG